uniref:Kinesin 5d protein n=1 Tax=Marsilea vestita TaxID=59764 RepID=A0A142KW97_MARVE|nr:kinesin 5d protein [Marsilea vestita]
MARLEKEKAVNVQVLLRCRPFSEDELLANAPQVITCNEVKREVSVNQNVQGKQVDRTFVFDKVFGPQSKQKDLYDQAIIPIVNEVLEGFNCTIFAYGQTGTGKTYTMEGSGRRTGNDELPPDAGVISRAIKQIFDTLELQNAEYSVKVTFLELYNEETTDLLAPEDFSKIPDEKKRPLSLMEDGKGGVIVRGLEEVVVNNATEIFNLLDRGSAKRRTAETLLNKQSSRSHSIFSITIHIKESTPDGEELIKCGKLNLVDLAGSENVCRSGAREGRAREAGEINKSLLTLGRVITSLVEHLGHVPYRDSKLTRLLRDSLGGRTKTCIIATVSPSVHCIEETLSTLDYAQRAKNIKNKPEVNQKLMKATLIKELYAEIERLKTELLASREKNGVYIPSDRFYQEEADRKALTIKIERLEDDLDSNRKQLEEMQLRYETENERCNEIQTQYQAMQKGFEETKQALTEAKSEIRVANDKIKEKDFIILSQKKSETALVEKTVDVRSNLEQAAQDVTGLFAKLERKKQVEAGNMKIIQNFQSQLDKCLNVIRKDVSTSIKQHQQHVSFIDDQIRTFLSGKSNFSEIMKSKVDDLKSIFSTRLHGLHNLARLHEEGGNLALDKVNETVSNTESILRDLLKTAVHDGEKIVQDLENTLLKQQNEVAAFAQEQREGIHRNLLAMKEVSNVALDALDEIGKRATELLQCVDESSAAHENRLLQFEKKLEEHAIQEEKQLIEDIQKLLSNSRARKYAMVNATLSTLREQTMSDKTTIQDGVRKVQSIATDTQGEWGTLMCQSEASATEDLRQVAARHCQMEMLIQNCMKGTNDVSNFWGEAQSSVEECTRNQISTIDISIRNTKNMNCNFTTEMKQASCAAQDELEVSNSSLHAHLEDNDKLDTEAGHSLEAALRNHVQELESLQKYHDIKVEEIQQETLCCLADIKGDQPTTMTPKRRDIHVPSRVSIEELRAPESDAILKIYKERMYKERSDTDFVQGIVSINCENPMSKLMHRNEYPVTRIPLARLN